MNNKSSMPSERARVLLSTKKDSSGRNNWGMWVVQCRDTLARFGKLAQVFDTNIGYVVPALNPEDWADQDGFAFTDAVRRDLYISFRQARAKKVREVDDMKPELYALLHATLSVESKIMVAGHADYGGADGANVLKDPNALWTILRQIHFLDVHQGGGEALQEMNKQLAVSKFEMCRQGPGRSIAEFRVEFDEHHMILEALEVPGYPANDATKAVSFLSKLDTFRHGEMQVALLNDARKPGAMNAYPATLNAAYELASTWTTRVRTRDYSGTASGESVFASILSDSVRGKPATVTKSGKADLPNYKKALPQSPSVQDVQKT